MGVSAGGELAESAASRKPEDLPSSSVLPSLFSEGLKPAERDANKGCRARIVVRDAPFPAAAAVSPSTSVNPPNKRNPPRGGYEPCNADVLGEDALEDSDSVRASVSPNVRLRRRESAVPHPRATRVAARSNISAIVTPPGQIDAPTKHGTRDFHRVASVFLDCVEFTTLINPQQP